MEGQWAGLVCTLIKMAELVLLLGRRLRGCLFPAGLRPPGIAHRLDCPPRPPRCPPQCALHPGMRQDWAAGWARGLAPGGKLVCLAFPIDPARKGQPGPPWYVEPQDYKDLLLPLGECMWKGGGGLRRC